jgi:hypothetical protein
LGERDISKTAFPLYYANGSSAVADYLTGGESGFGVYINDAE